MPTDATTPSPEVTGAETTVQTEPTVETTTEPTAPTVAEVMEEKKSVPESVPMARLNKEISRRKELEKKLEEMQKQLESGDTSVAEVDGDLQKLAEEHNIDANFLEKLAASIKAQAQKDLDEKLKPLTEREAREKKDKLFNEHFQKAIESVPEFKDVVDPDVIRQMAFNPENATMTFVQLIEKAYGKSIQGRRTIETTVPRGGAKIEQIDYAKARSDKSYFKEIMADPALKKEYNNNIENRIGL